MQIGFGLCNLYVQSMCAVWLRILGVQSTYMGMAPPDIKGDGPPKLKIKNLGCCFHEGNTTQNDPPPQ